MRKEFKMYELNETAKFNYGIRKDCKAFAYYLEPDNIAVNQVSFYKKAYVIYNESLQIETLYSYGTKIISYNRDKNLLTRHWQGYSRTTMKHIKSFLAYNGIYSMNKQQWDDLY